MRKQLIWPQPGGRDGMVTGVDGSQLGFVHDRGEADANNAAGPGSGSRVASVISATVRAYDGVERQQTNEHDSENETQSRTHQAPIINQSPYRQHQDDLRNGSQAVRGLVG